MFTVLRNNILCVPANQVAVECRSEHVDCCLNESTIIKQHVFFPPSTDRHKSFKLRLPSIRRDIRSKASVLERIQDTENPPIPEESVPLNQLMAADMPDAVPRSPFRRKSESGLENEVEEDYLGSQDRLMVANQCNLRKASSLEGLDSSTHIENEYRKKSNTFSECKC